MSDVWQPIETAPKDGTDVLLWWRAGKRPCVGYWAVDDLWGDPDFYHTVEEGWRCVGAQCIPVDQSDCTHWMPLPKGPV